MSRLRLIILSVLAISSTAPSARAATGYLTESTVTLQLTVQKTSRVIETGPDAEGLVVRETTIESRRLGNHEVLAEMKRRGLIPEVKGHSLVAVWANWPDEAPFKGNAFRFFVRKTGAKAPALTRVPKEVFALTPQDWLHERDIRREAGVITSGSERVEAYSQVALDLGDDEGTFLGADIGGGVFKPAVKKGKLQYLPRPGTVSLDGTLGGGVSSGQVDFGQARFVAKSDFKPGALPKKTRAGGYYGWYGSISMNGTGLIPFYIPPFVHYFCPLTAELTLSHQATVPSGENGREVTQIQTTTLTHEALLRGALQAQGITDSEGWGLYLHGQSDIYENVEDFDLLVAHSDGRVIRLGEAEFALSYGKAEAARREFRNGVYTFGTIRQLAHLTHNQSWALADRDRLRLLLTGPATIESRFGAIPEAQGLRHVQPVAASLRLFGSYDKDAEGGLARVTFTIGAPLPQTEIPAGWSDAFPWGWPTVSYW